MGLDIFDIMAFTFDIQRVPHGSAAEADRNSAMRQFSSSAATKLDHYIESNRLGASKRVWVLSRQSRRLTIPDTYASINIGGLLHGSDDVVGSGGSPPPVTFLRSIVLFIGVIAGAYFGVGLLELILKLGLLRFLLHHGQMRRRVLYSLTRFMSTPHAECIVGLETFSLPGPSFGPLLMHAKACHDATSSDILPCPVVLKRIHFSLSCTSLLAPLTPAYSATSRPSKASGAFRSSDGGVTTHTH
jgi:hypothetical protein